HATDHFTSLPFTGRLLVSSRPVAPTSSGSIGWAMKAECDLSEQLHKGRNVGQPLLWSVLITLLCAHLAVNEDPAASGANTSRCFQRYYCAFIGISMLCNHLEGHGKFYRWFYSSGIEPSKKRGLGHAGKKFYGLISAPFLTPKQHEMAALVTIMSLFISCGPWAPRFFLFVAYFGWFFYYSQLFCATKAGGHGTTLVPGTLLMLALSPLNEATREGHDLVWPVEFIKLQIAAMYCGSGLCKLGGAFAFRRIWSGTTLQAYTFDSMWSRPGGEITWALQAFAVRSPRLLIPAAVGALFFEVAFPFALTSYSAGLFFTALGLSFHTGIYFLQGFDFLSQWCPVYFLFALHKDASIQSTMMSLEGGFDALIHLEFSGFLVAYLYTMISIMVSLVMLDVWYGEVLPWSCCPMFLVPRNLFSQDMPRWWTMTGRPDQRDAGYMDPLMYSPVSTKHYMPEEDLQKYPYKVLQFGSLSQVPKELQKFVLPQYLGHPVDDILCFSNFPITAELREALTEMVRLTFSYSEEDTFNSEALGRLVEQQRRCRYFFEEAEFKAKWT
ncbi:Uncharacterized protein SCF082_LOCUS2856, partial [Durusdinium trenchii]